MLNAGWNADFPFSAFLPLRFTPRFPNVNKLESRADVHVCRRITSLIKKNSLHPASGFVFFLFNQFPGCVCRKQRHNIWEFDAISKITVCDPWLCATHSLSQSLSEQSYGSSFLFVKRGECERTERETRRTWPIREYGYFGVSYTVRPLVMFYSTIYSAYS